MAKPRHVITLLDFSTEELKEILALAGKIKANPTEYADFFKNKTLAMLFQKTSTRTRVSFESGMTQLGGHGIFLDWRTTQLGISSLEEEGRVIASMADMIMARLKKHSDLVTLAEGSSVPVINGLCEKFHPCQIICDLLTIQEKKEKLEGLTLTYVGIENNVSNSLVLGCTKLGMKIILCYPETDPDCKDERMEAYKKEMQEKGLLVIEPDLQKAVSETDIVYTDTWVNMEFFTDPSFKEEKERRLKVFMPYQINKKVIDMCKKDVLIMHLMPVHRDYEMTKDVVYLPNSIIFEQAENRLHGQKGIMVWLMGKGE